MRRAAKKDRKPLLIALVIGGAVILVVLIVMACLMLSGGDEPATSEPSDISLSESEESEGAEVSQEENAVSDISSMPSSGTSLSHSTTVTTGKKPTVSTTQSSAVDLVKIPYTIPGTTLTIRKIDGYTGLFLEDGSDRDIENVTAIVLTNSGSKDVELAQIQLLRDGTPLTFTASCIPAGATVMVQEANATAYREGLYTAVSANVTDPAPLGFSSESVGLVENADGTLTITNLTDKTIPAVRVFYKFYMAEEKAYVGGITYTAKLTDLAPGASQTVSPSHYGEGASKVVMVRTYESDE